MKKTAAYIRAVFETPAGLADEAAGILIANGALGCAVQRGGRAGARSKRPVQLEAFFSELAPSQLRSIRRTMRAAGMLTDSDPAGAAQTIVDPGWATMWQKRFEPLRVGDRFMIVPPWHPASDNGLISMTILPGQGFGTGHHPTTSDAMIALAELIERHRFTHAIDVGTGSGILALAMRLLGVAKVTAIDNDATALDNARENAALNHVTTGIDFSITPIARIKKPFPLVVANILSSTLIAMAPDLKRILAKSGFLVLGGILAREVKKITAHYAPELRLVDKRITKGWATLIFVRDKVR